MYKIVFTGSAEKEYRHLYTANRPIFDRVRTALISIAKNPIEGKALRLNLKGLRSYRVGTYRAIYEIKDEILTVYVIDIGHRREVYR